MLVELFTSEGCSSCPPADELLARLDQQPIPGIHAIVLSEHVTYWDSLGWKDPFSLDAITQRQQDYAARFHLQSVYTPQAVIGGQAQCVGTDARRLVEAIREAAAQPRIPLTIDSARWNGKTVQFSISGPAAPEANLYVALADETQQMHVQHGENGGHTLHHVAVVRTLHNFGRLGGKGQAPFSTSLSLPLAAPDALTTAPIRLVVFLTDRKNGHVIGAVEQTLQRVL
ncbi:MAG TPA: DUF1223 domain-containing protein [Acidobacteriaceae bacterium]